MPSSTEHYEVISTIGSYGKCQKIRRKSDGKDFLRPSVETILQNSLISVYVPQEEAQASQQGGSCDLKPPKMEELRLKEQALRQREQDLKEREERSSLLSDADHVCVFKDKATWKEVLFAGGSQENMRPEQRVGTRAQERALIKSAS